MALTRVGTVVMHTRIKTTTQRLVVMPLQNNDNQWGGSSGRIYRLTQADVLVQSFFFLGMVRNIDRGVSGLFFYYMNAFDRDTAGSTVLSLRECL